MTYSAVCGNPPFGDIHLKIIENIIPSLEKDGYGCFVHPARWYEDPLAEYKKGSDKVKFKGLVERLDDVRIIDNRTVEKLFGIIKNGELMISTVKSEPTGKDIKVFGDIAQECIDVILTYSIEQNLAQHIDKDKVEGWRVQVKDMTAIDPHIDSMTEYDRKGNCNLFGMNRVNVFCDGSADGVEWMKTRRQINGKRSSGSPIPLSIKFRSEQEAVNFERSCNTNFYQNIMYLLKVDMHSPLKFLPWMEDYSHAWTDDDYCRFFGGLGMSEECQKWMCRDVYDYRFKDFVQYEQVS